MVISEQEVVIGEFYARKVRGHIIVRKVISVYSDDKDTWVKFIVYNLVGKKESQSDKSTMGAFLKWVDWVATDSDGTRTTASIKA